MFAGTGSHPVLGASVIGGSNTAIVRHQVFKLSMLLGNFTVAAWQQMKSIALVRITEPVKMSLTGGKLFIGGQA